MSIRVSNVSFSDASKLNDIKAKITPAPSQPQTVTTQSTTPQANQSELSQSKSNFIKENINLINTGLVLVSLGVATTAAVRSGRGSKLISSAESKSSELGSKLNELGVKLENITSEVSALTSKNKTLETNVSTITTQANEAGKKAEKAAETTKEGGWFDNWLKSLSERLQGVESTVSRKAGAIMDRTMLDIDGIPLLRHLDNEGNPIKLSSDTIEWLQKVSGRFINKGKNHIGLNKLSKDDAVWSLTSESIPEKDGGLGEVPVQIAKNLTETFKINNSLVRPMTLIPGKSQLVRKGEKTIYRYNINDTKPWEMEVTKVAEFKTQVCRNGKYQSEPIEVYVGKDPKFGFDRIMFANDNYFTSEGLYKDSIKVSEVERYAFFDKVTYDFAKLVADPNSLTHYSITNPEAFSKIKVPKALLLNDWHAGGVAGLMRLKSVCEAEKGELSKQVAEAFKTMNILNINHNLDYQGMDYAHRSDILNTLFDKYAYDIYRYAKTGFGEAGLDKVCMTGDSVNLANMGACLSHMLKPVSPNYAFEVATQPTRSRYMLKILETRLNQGTLYGASNGWDRVLNEVSQANIKGFNDAINSDKLEIFKNNILNIRGLTSEQLSRIRDIFNADNGMDSANFKVKIEQLRLMESPAINQAIDIMEEKGIIKLREILPYTYADSTEVIMMNRRHNKQQFIDYINNMNETNKRTSGDEKLFTLAESHLTDLSNITPEELDDIVVFNMGVRFVSQKGVDVACNAIKRVLTQWESKHPGRRKPIFVIGGKDGENGKIRKLALLLKQELGSDLGKYVVYQDGYTKNNIFQAGSDFTLYSSHFEPDGAKWESLYKGTPVLCTRVGGHVDSVKDLVNGFLSKRTIPEIEKSTSGDYGKYLEAFSNDFADIIDNAVKLYYNRPAYTKMVEEAIRGDQSWLMKDANGNVTGGALLGHMKDLGFDLKDFPQIHLDNAA